MVEHLFSIIVPVYNVEKYIKRCIDSVLSQTYNNFELILVDDGSTDDSGKICDEYAKSDSRVVVIHKANGGQLSAREAALKASKGDRIVFLDSDDYLDPSALEVLDRNFKETQSDCICYGRNLVDVDDNVIEQSQNIMTAICTSDKRILYKMFFMDQTFNTLWCKAIKRDLLNGTEHSRFYHIKQGEDLLQSIKIYENTQKVTFIPDHLYNYRVNPTSITQSLNHQNYVIDFTVRQKVLDFLKNENVWTDTDYIEYWNYCVSLFVVEIIRVSNFSASYKTIKSFYKDLAKTEYYMTFLSNERHKTDNSILSKNKERIFVAFKHKRYLLVYLMLRIKRMFGHI